LSGSALLTMRRSRENELRAGMAASIRVQKQPPR
jgi:hypothetical protein